MNVAFMPIGKYRGKLIENLPTEYLKWIMESDCWRGLSQGHQREIRLTLENRKRNDKH